MTHTTLYVKNAFISMTAILPRSGSACPQHHCYRHPLSAHSLCSVSHVCYRMSRHVNPCLCSTSRARTAPQCSLQACTPRANHLCGRLHGRPTRRVKATRMGEITSTVNANKADRLPSHRSSRSQSLRSGPLAVRKRRNGTCGPAAVRGSL